ncbi:MAG TPA: hypothetical protein VHO25_13500 [Polyangiaceae bacterium]|nr:hypothetical protein [Polyangiaceae bacterium]
MRAFRRRFSFLVAGGLLSVAPTALAAEPTKTQLALDLDFVHPVSEPSVDAGGGGALRLGQQLDLVALSLTGEFGFGYHSFGGTADPREYTAFAGGRIAIGKFLEPGAFLHVAASRLVNDFAGSWAPEMDFGLFLDLTVFPLLDLGVHGTYVHRFATSDTSTFRYMIIGPHVALLF